MSTQRSSGFIYADNDIHTQSKEAASNGSHSNKKKPDEISVPPSPSPDFNLRFSRRSCCFSIQPRTDGQQRSASTEETQTCLSSCRFWFTSCLWKSRYHSHVTDVAPLGPRDSEGKWREMHLRKRHLDTFPTFSVTSANNQVMSF